MFNAFKAARDSLEALSGAIDYCDDKAAIRKLRRLRLKRLRQCAAFDAGISRRLEQRGDRVCGTHAG